MTDAPALGTGSRLDFMAPLSGQRADRLVADLVSRNPATPTPEQLANMWAGMTVDDCTYLPSLVDEAVAAGFRPLRIETATRGEWEEFESGLAADLEDWLLAHPGHPESDAIRDKLDKQRDIWLRGHRDVMGFAYLTLGVPV